MGYHVPVILYMTSPWGRKYISPGDVSPIPTLSFLHGFFSYFIIGLVLGVFPLLRSGSCLSPCLRQQYGLGYLFYLVFQSRRLGSLSTLFQLLDSTSISNDGRHPYATKPNGLSGQKVSERVSLQSTGFDHAKRGRRENSCKTLD